MRVDVLDTVTGDTTPHLNVDVFRFEEVDDDPGPRLVIEYRDGDMARLNAERYDVVGGASSWS